MRNGVGGRCRQGLSSQLFRTRDVGRGRFGIIAGWGNVDSSCESLPTAPTTPAANTRAKTLVSRLRKAGSRERRTPEGDGFEGGGFRAWELRHDSEAFMDDNRAEEGYFGLENGGVQSLPPGGFPCYLDPKLLISLFFCRQGF